MAASPDVPHAQWTASTMDWNTLTFEAFDARGTTKRRKPGSNTCQAPGCNVDLTDAKPYFKRHCICSLHMKAPYVLMNGVKMRYCQQCGHFEPLDVFVGVNRSCKMSLERRSAMAQNSKQKNGRYERARDQQVSRMSVSDDSSSDKAGGIGGKSSVWGSPVEPKKSDVDNKGTTSGQARDVDMFADSTAATNQGPTFSIGNQNPALGAPPAPVFSTAANSGAYFSAPGRLLPPAAPSRSGGATMALGALNLQQDSSGAASSAAGVTGNSADGRFVMQLTHRAAALSQCQRSNFEQSLPSQLFMDSADGINGDGFAGGYGGLMGVSSRCSTDMGAGIQLTAPTAPQVAGGPSWRPVSEEPGGGGGANVQVNNNYPANASRYPGLGVVVDPVNSLAENLLWGDPRPPLYSAATAPALHSIVDSIAGIQDAGLEQQLQDILQSARMEGMGWFGDGGTGAGGPSTSAAGTMARSGVSSGWGNGPRLGTAWKGGVEGGGNGAYGMEGTAGGMNNNTMANCNGSAQLGAALQYTDLGNRGAASLAAAEPYTGQFTGAAASSLLSTTSAYMEGDGRSRPTPMATAFQRNTGGPTTAAAGLAGCAAGTGPQLYSGGGAGSNSSLRTCMAYLQHQQQYQQQRGRGGMPGGIAESLMGGSSVQRTKLAYRSGEPDPLVRVALKLTSRSPDELDSVTLASLRKLLSVYDRLQSMQGYVRPGCTHLIIDAHRALLFPYGGAAFGSSGGAANLRGLAVDHAGGGPGCNEPMPAVLQHNLAANGPSGSANCSSEHSCGDQHNNTLEDGSVQQSSMLSSETVAVLQQLASVYCEGRGCLRQQMMLDALVQIAASNRTDVTMQLENLTLTVREDGSLGSSRPLEDLPTIVAASCVAISSDDVAMEVTLYGAQLQRPGVIIWARMHGVCYQLQTRPCYDGGVAVRLPLLTTCGLLQLEAGRQDRAVAALGPSYPLLVLPSAAAVVEVHLIAGAMGPASLRRFVADLGALLDTGALLSQPLNGVVPVRSADTLTGPPSHPGTWGSTESDLQVGGEGSADHMEQGPACLLGSEPGGAPVVAEVLVQPRRWGGNSRNSSHSGSPANSTSGADFRLMNGDPTEGMSNADDEQAVEQLLNADAVESLLESALALLHVMIERSMPHCLTAVVASLAELHERFPDRVNCGMLSSHRNHSRPQSALQLEAAGSTTGSLNAAKGPQEEANDTEVGDGGVYFGLMHVAARAGDLHALVTLGSLEGVLGEQCSLLLRGVAGVTPLHLLAMSPQAPRLLRSLRQLFPGIDQALTTARADDGLTPLLLYQMVHPPLPSNAHHPPPPNNPEARAPAPGGSANMAGEALAESWDATRSVVAVAAISAPGNIYTRSFSDLPRVIANEEQLPAPHAAAKDAPATLRPRALTSRVLGGMALPEAPEPRLSHDSSAHNVASATRGPTGRQPTAAVDEQIPTDMLLAAASSEVFSDEWKSVEASEESRGSTHYDCDTEREGHQSGFLGSMDNSSDAAAFLASRGTYMTNPTSAAAPPSISVTTAVMMAGDAVVRSESASRLVGWAGATQPALAPAADHVTPPPPQRHSGSQVNVVPAIGLVSGATDMHSPAVSATGVPQGLVPTGRVVSAVMTASGAAKPVLISEVFHKPKGQVTGNVAAPITYCTAPGDSDDGSTDGVSSDGDATGSTLKLEALGAPTSELLGTAANTGTAKETSKMVAQPEEAMGDRTAAQAGAAAGTSAAAEGCTSLLALVPKISFLLAAAAALHSRMALVLTLAPVYGIIIARQSLPYFGGGAVDDVRFVGNVLTALTAVQLLAALSGDALGLGHNAVTLLHWLAEAQHVGLLLAMAIAEINSRSSTEHAAGISAGRGTMAPLWLLVVSYILFGPICYITAALRPQLGVMRWAWLATRVHIIASSLMSFGVSHRGA